MSHVILYACIAKKNNILVEYSLRSGNFFTIIYKIISSLSQDDQTLTYVFEGHQFNIKVYNFITYLCLTRDDVSRRISYLFLDDICNLFDPIKNDALETGKFGWTLQEKMKIYSNPKYEFSQIEAIQKEVDDVKKIMIQNIENLMKREDDLKILDDATVSIEIEADKFKIGAIKVKENIKKWHILKILMIVGVVIILIIVALALWYAACGGKISFQCEKPPINKTIT